MNNNITPDTQSNTSEFKSSVGLCDDIYTTDNIFGADTTSDIQQLLQNNFRQKYSCVAINLRLTKKTNLDQLLDNLKSNNPYLQFIFFEAQNYHDPLIPIINKYKVFKILADRDENMLYRSIVDAKSEYDLSAQNDHLLELIKEKNLKLRDLNVDLELRIQNRQISLEESRLKLIQANKYYSTLLQCLVGIQKASSLPEIEKSLLINLSEPLKIKIVKLQFQNSTAEIDSTAKHIFKNKIDITEPFDAYILYFKKADDIFSKEEQIFLKQISSAVSLALKKMSHEQSLKDLKQQWQITFDAIKEPVSLITENYDVIQWNSSFNKFSPIKNEKCYKNLFNRTSPCEHCSLGDKFKIPIQKTSLGDESHFSVESKWIDTLNNQKIFLNIYRDLAEQRRVERQILESSKLGELGLIGGSIAHELNNPLAGLITFIQMLKSDIKKEPDLLKDISDMETAALRCKEIIQNLLSFTRKSSEQNEKIHIKDVLNKTLRVLQVKTKPIGLNIETHYKVQQDLILGQANPLTQAFVNILNNALESVDEKRKLQKNFNPNIQVHVSENKDSKSLTVDIYDNGLGLTTDQQLKAYTPFYTTKNAEIHRGLGLTVAYQIIKDHLGDIDISQVSDGRVRVRVTLPIL